MNYSHCRFTTNMISGIKSEYEHRLVCLKCHCVDPLIGIHAQNIESYNNKR